MGSPSKTPTLVDDSGMAKDLANDAESSIITMEPFVHNELNEREEHSDSPILHVRPIPLNWSFDVISDEFSKFGKIEEIRNRLEKNYRSFETWIIFHSGKDAFRACKEFRSGSENIKCTLVDIIPQNLDIYRPANQMKDHKPSATIERSPEPARWLIITSRGDHGNLFKIKKYVNQKLGHVNRPDITRFGRSSFLVHTRSNGQAAMLLNLRLEQEGIIKEIKPHYNFSYVKGVIFNEDIHELTEDEILEMCPEEVWKIFKVPRSSMIILTFKNSVLPTEIVLESELMRVRPYKTRVLQCYNCYGFGHASRVCTRDKICEFCSQPEHGDCDRQKLCVNCKEEHDARNKKCKVFKKEEEALLKSLAEHISIGHAKKLLARRSYSDIVRESSQASSSGGPRASFAGAP